jgi:hypothetical protein
LRPETRAKQEPGKHNPSARLLQPPGSVALVAQASAREEWLPHDRWYKNQLPQADACAIEIDPECTAGNFVTNAR